MVFGYSTIDSKVCQEDGVGEKKEPKDNILEDIMFMILWKPLVGKCLHCVKEPTNGMEKNVVAVVCANSLCKEEVMFL